MWVKDRTGKVIGTGDRGRGSSMLDRSICQTPVELWAGKSVGIERIKRVGIGEGAGKLFKGASITGGEGNSRGLRWCYDFSGELFDLTEADHL